MALPYAAVNVRDGALGLVNPSTSNVVALAGVCSGGTVGSIYSFTDPQAVQAALGTGPLVEAACFVLALSGAGVLCIKVNTTTPGTAGSVTHTGSAGLSVVTTTGSVPLDSYQVSVLIVQGGTLPTAGTATYKLSVDGGRTYGPETALPATGIITNTTYGLTLTFSAATVGATDTYTFTCTGPAYSTSDLQTALTALLADPRTWFLLYCVGIPADAPTTQGVYGVIQTNLATAATNYRFARGLMQCADLADSAIITAVSALQDTRVMVAAGFANGTSVTNGSQMKLPAANYVSGRAAQVPPSEDLGRVASGNVKGIVQLIRDEFKTPGLDFVQLVTLRTIPGLAGAYITNPNIKAGPTSDFKYLQYGRVMDMASDAVRQGMLRFLNDAVRVNSTTGLIYEEDARRIEQFIQTQLRAAVVQPGYASDCTVQLDRSVNVISTQRLAIKFRIVPLGYAKFIDGDLGFSNPALQLV